MLIIAALMTVGSIFQTNTDVQRIAKAKKTVGAIEGDHITMINIYNIYTRKQKNARKSYCGEMYINERTLIKAIKIKLQLKEYLHIMGVKINKSDDYDDPPAILKSLITGFFMNVAHRQIDGSNSYKNIRSSEILEIHPTSVLANIKPKWVIYNDIFTTTKRYMREVSEIDIDWVLEL
jgi:HrpA-like RNA helicase